jgi:hypothetical protein
MMRQHITLGTCQSDGTREASPASAELNFTEACSDRIEAEPQYF